jgi:hypothetical protein
LVLEEILRKHQENKKVIQGKHRIIKLATTKEDNPTGEPREPVQNLFFTVFSPPLNNYAFTLITHSLRTDRVGNVLCSRESHQYMSVNGNTIPWSDLGGYRLGKTEYAISRNRYIQNTLYPETV